MQIKDGVDINGIKPELVMGFIVADSVYKDLGKELVVTAVVDGKHGIGSFHYIGLAGDLRTRFFDDNGEEAARRLRVSLGKQWDVVLEKDHIHIEFNPK